MIRILQRIPVAAALCLAFYASCVSMNISSPQKDRPVVLQNADAECEAIDSFGQYYLLFGAAPLRTIPPERMFPEADKSYRLIEELKWYDMLLTIVGGAFLSLSKNTVTVEECEQSGVFASAADRDAALARLAAESAQAEQKRIAKRLDAFAKARSETFDATLVLKNGDVLAGRIKSISEEAVALEVRADETGPENRAGDAQTTNPNTDPKKPADSVGTRVVPRVDIVRFEFRDPQ
jgi:hypothetical protein